MDPIATVKEKEQAQTPLLLLDCTFGDGSVRRWATHAVIWEDAAYDARVLQHNAFEVQSMSEQGLDQVPRLSFSLANADGAMSQLEQSKGFKGARLLARFIFYDLAAGSASPDSLVVFSGYCNPPDEVTDSGLRVTAINRMNTARVALPPVKIQRRCPWSFPATAEQRAAAMGDSSSPFHACGYSPDVPGGCGRRQPNGEVFTSCGYTRADCIARGMFNHDAAALLVAGEPAESSTLLLNTDLARVGDVIDVGGSADPRNSFSSQEEVRVTWKSGVGPFVFGITPPLRHAHGAGEPAGRPTRRFGGIEFVPETIDVRPYGSPSTIKAPVQGPAARYNDYIPVIYGTVWMGPLVTALRNDGNLSRMEAVLSLGRIFSIKRVVVSDFEIPAGVPGRDMTGSGWYNQITDGEPWGGFDLNFTDRQGNPQGDPYGSVAYLSVVVPNKINDGKSTPRIQVLLDGRMVETFAEDGSSLGFSFSNNTAWVLLDLLKLARWPLSDVDLPSFARAAAFCGEMIPATDNDGYAVTIPRFQCNLVLAGRRPATDVILGVRNNARLFFTYSAAGKLQVQVENTMALQQPEPPYGSNAIAPIADGWPAYVYADTNGTITRRSDGSSSVRVTHRSITDTPNRFAFEFQDEFNQYVQDSLAIDDLDDQQATGQEVSQTLAVDGIPNFDQAARIAKFHLDKSVKGNAFVEFETSVKAVGQQVGQLIALSYAREGWTNQLFRILRIAPRQNFRTVLVTAQVHDDAWYGDTNRAEGACGAARRYARRNPRPPNPLVGVVPRADGDMDWLVAEHAATDSDGTGTVELEVGFSVPSNCFQGTAGAPIADLMATVQPDNGSIAGDQSLYYRVTALDGDGQESMPSFAVRAVVPEGTNTNSVLLTGLRFDSSAAAFGVYRGADPTKMLPISADLPIADSFLDTGFSCQPGALPDPYFDHANFYWRKRLIAEVAAEIAGATTIGSNSLSLSPDQYAGCLVRVVQGTGAGQVRRIVSHDQTILQIFPDWAVVPGADSLFHIEEPDWKIGSAAASSPARFRVPNQAGTLLLVQGRAADEHDSESPQALAAVTTWTVGGVGQGVSDSGVPPAPVFGISVPRDGTLVLAPITFPELTNVAGITSASYEVYHADELAPVVTAVGGETGIGPDDETLQVVDAAGFQAGDYFTIDREVLCIREMQDTNWAVTRGEHGTEPAAHALGARVDRLLSRVFTFPFEPGFFLSPDAGKWSAMISVPHVRLAGVHAHVSNAFGDSERTINNYLGFDCDGGAAGSLPGLRTNRGGQFVFQVEGRLNLENDPTPPVPVHLDGSVRDMYALVRTAPSGAAIQLTVKRNGAALQTLTIADGQTVSAAASGAALSPLCAGDLLAFDIDSVGTAEPGRDLTLILRM
jgi:hypothetical protein